MEKPIKSHKDLEIWKRSIKLVTEIYKLTKSFPDDEKYGLTSQIRRASISVPSNISEGAARKSTRDYVRFLYMSLGSLSELDTQLTIAQNLDYAEDIEDIFAEIKSLKLMIHSVVRKLKAKAKLSMVILICLLLLGV